MEDKPAELISNAPVILSIPKTEWDALQAQVEGMKALLQKYIPGCDGCEITFAQEAQALLSPTPAGECPGGKEICIDGGKCAGTDCAVRTPAGEWVSVRRDTLNGLIAAKNHPGKLVVVNRSEPGNEESLTRSAHDLE